MALALEIIVGVMILASLGVAFMSAKTWPIYQVVLVVFVFLGAVTFFYLSARTLRTHQNWGKALNQAQKDVETQQAQLKRLVEGGGVDANGQPDKGIRQLRRDLERLARDRGGVLRDVEVTGVKDGVVGLKFKSPDHGLVVNSVIYAFDQAAREQGGRYEGEFKVVSVAEGGAEVQAAPNLPLTESQAKAVASAQGPWVLYLTMPVDDPTVFAGMDEATRQALLPADSVAAYGSADRDLHDYAAFFENNYVQRSLLADSIAKTNNNIQRMETATKEAQAEIGYRQAEQTALNDDLKQFRVELKAIADYQGKLEKAFAQLRETLKATYLSTKERAARLTEWQLKAAAEINRQTAAASNALPTPVATANP